MIGKTTPQNAEGVPAWPEIDNFDVAHNGNSSKIDPVSGVKRGLKNRHLSMMALAGVIGPGLLVGAGGALNNGGPASLLIGFAVIGLIAFSIMQSLGEMTTLYPGGGSFISLADRFVDKAFAVAVGWNYFIIWAAVLANEYNVVSSMFVFWSDKLPLWGYFLIFWFAFLGFQLLGVEAFGEAEFWLALVKLLGLTAYFMFAIIYAAGGLESQHHALGFQYWHNPGPFNGNGFRGVAIVFVFCSTFYAGCESVAVAATEARNPGIAVPQAIRQVFWRIIFVHKGSAFSFGLTCPANDSGLIDGSSRALQSPMTIAIQTAGWQGGVHLINAFIFITCLSAVNSSIYIGSRTMLYMAQSGKAPRFLSWTDKRGVPVFAILLTNAFGALAMMNISTGASEAYSYIVNLSGVSAFLVWGSISFIHIRFRAAWHQQGRTKAELLFKSLWYPWNAYIGLFANVFLALVQGWTSLSPFDAGSFVDAYILLPLFPIIYLAFKVVQKTHFQRACEVDLDSGRRSDLDTAETAADDSETAAKVEMSVPAVGRTWRRRIITIADYAARHFEKHKRPLRIAVDEACWRFTNLTPEQVQRIRDGEPAANPVERTFLFRALRLMKLNMQLLFVGDGIRKPWKRGKGSGGRVDKELIKLSHQLFDHLKIPYHQAPGEAEAECAALQQRGVVDAVWSDDGDAFMFGCRTLIKQHKHGKDRVNDYVKVFTAESIAERLDPDQDSFVLFAMLSGGDYDTQGLRGCGPQLAKLVARREYGVARAACHVKQNQLPMWRDALQKALTLCGRAMEVPSTFPDYKALGHYREPAVSTPEQLDNLRGLRHGSERPIDQTKLRVFLRHRFNFDTKSFLKHMAPLYLTRALARVNPEQRSENLQYAIQLKRTRKPKIDGGDAPPKTEFKITFCPVPAIEIDLSQQPPEEDWSKRAEKDGTPYDPVQNVECEVLGCLLRHGLPEGALETGKANIPTEDSAGGGPSCAAAASTVPAAKKRGRPKSDASADATPKPPRKRGKKADAAQPTVEKPPSPPPATFKLPRGYVPPPAYVPRVLTLDDSSSESEGEAEVIHPASSAPGSIRLDGDISPLFVSPAKVVTGPLVPGESIARDTLRDLRAASALLNKPTVQPDRPIAVPSTPRSAPSRSRAGITLAHEVIDLT
ncbi:hypothetical protein LTR85_004845 [Meristemomyces frigidus]|nr:hypothetical protein LTR85_004845 [Meristemomyces frigidus]